MTKIEQAARQLKGDGWRDAAYPITRHIIAGLPPDAAPLGGSLFRLLATPKVALDFLLDGIEPQLIKRLGQQRFDELLQDAVQRYRN